MTQPTQADIEAAKKYIIGRLDAEHAMTSLLEKAMKAAATRIVEICYAVNANPQNFSYAALPPRAQDEIDEVISDLQDQIDDYFLTFAIADHEENEDTLLPLILGENNGATFDERLSDYCDKYKNELMLLVGAGLFLGIAKDALAKTIGDNLRHPYANQMLAEGIDADISYGRGRTNSMLTAIDNLTRYGIDVAWMRNWELKTAADGCIGWVVQRGSNYPCELCDSNCGFHSVDEGTNLPMHGHCACFAVPIYVR